MESTGLWLAVVTFTLGSLAQDPFIEPVRELYGVEFYEYQDERYGFYTQPVTWDEADMLCPAANGSLVEFTEDLVGLPEFISRALAESAVGFGALWIGGRYIPFNGKQDGSWKWVSSDTPIDAILEGVTDFPMKVSPYWVSRPDLKSPKSLCLGTDRRLHHLPLIVPVECKQKRPFICRISESEGSKPREISPPITIKGKKFRIFAGELTWAEALAQCQHLGMSLAKLTTTEEFTLIGNRMKRHRPVMENAWISGIFTDGKWKWISTDELINVAMSSESPNEPVAWYRPDNIIMDGCLLADRHICDHFVYVEAKCDRRRNYICEKRFEKTFKQSIEPVQGYEDIYISSYEDTWYRAQNVCRVCGGGSLLQIEATPEGVDSQLKVFYAAMTQCYGVELRHVWLGGYLFNHTFMWTNEADTVPGNDKEITVEKYKGLDANGKDGNLEYCQVDFNVDREMLKYKCLNLDRENQKNFFMYGLKCELKQRFICKTKNQNADASCKLFNDPIQLTNSPPPKEKATTSSASLKAVKPNIPETPDTTDSGSEIST